MNVTADVIMRDSQASSGYWDQVSDALADLVRVMLGRCFDEKGYPELYKHCCNLRGEVWLCAFPNVFITIAPAEWKFPRPYFMEAYKHCVFAGAYIMALHMFYLVRCIWLFLAGPYGHRFFVVYEWVFKTEYQGRGTPHWHIAAWVVCFGLLSWLQGRTGTSVVSAFVKYLSMLFCCEIDVQIGNGRLNYINGYVSKDHDAVDVGLGEYVQKNATSSWLAAYRLLSKSTPCLPEVAIRMAQLSEFERSYANVLLYPPQPVAVLDPEGRKGNFSQRMYGFYLREVQTQTAAGVPVSQSFLAWHRGKEYDPSQEDMRVRVGRRQQRDAATEVVACRYWFELTDGYWGQFSLTQLPHMDPKYLLPGDLQHLESMQNFVGIIHYLLSTRWSTEEGIVCAGEFRFGINALPLIIDDQGEVCHVGTKYAPGVSLFPTDRHAFEYGVVLAKRDLQYRGFRDERIGCFVFKQEANFLLYQHVRDCDSRAAYECLRQEWDAVNRPQYSDKQWSTEQFAALKAIREGVSFDDEEARSRSDRWLYVPGPPGSGKSAVLLAAAMEHCPHMQVLLCAPTGFLVNQYKSKVPDVPGAENIRIDTIQGVLNYKRVGSDSRVTWTPPSALRRIDLILMDEGSQYEDREWTRLFQCIKEQPHSPYCVLVADFQQLQPVVSGGKCRAFSECMRKVQLHTVYRSADPAHLVFLNSIREEQPSRGRLVEYFGDRHWKGLTLGAYVKRGMQLARDKGVPFTWLTATNRGASEVCAEALRLEGITDEELQRGYYCDPATKSELRIVAKPGVVVRLSRNFDKQRGFVNGAIGVVCHSLRGNAVFTVRLQSTNNMVLVHPMEERGERFLPCCYGYATTIRRAQGADLEHGCMYFDQLKRPAARGYGYVAASRFKTRSGCHLYGKLRRSDFLPVGPDLESEHLERGYESMSSADSDGAGLEYAFSEGSGEESDTQDLSAYTANFLKDFEPLVEPGEEASMQDLSEDAVSLLNDLEPAT